MTFDVDAYLARIGLKPGRVEYPATRQTLATLMRAHVFSIPFENLDSVSGRAPSLELDDLAAKLVAGGRGGYCYEHNLLFAAVLRELGYTVSLHTGRVLYGMRRGDAVRPRSHTMLLVHLDDQPEPYLVDVGFGTVGCLLAPMPLVANAELRDEPRRHRLLRETGPNPLPTWTLQAHTDGEWVNQYMFTEETFQPVDYQVLNWYISTFPRSPFKLAPFVQRNNPERHLELTGSTLTERHADGSRGVREIEDRAELIHLLRTEFGIDVPSYFAEGAD